MTRHRLLAALAITVGFVLAGCFGDSALGPCTLQVAVLHDGGGSTALTPPYMVGRAQRVIYSGDGWTQMNVELRGPLGSVTRGQLDAQSVRKRDQNGSQFDRPGTWQVRLSDPVSGCVREFAVESA